MHQSTGATFKKLVNRRHLEFYILSSFATQPTLCPYIFRLGDFINTSPDMPEEEVGMNTVVGAPRSPLARLTTGVESTVLLVLCC